MFDNIKDIESILIEDRRNLHKIPEIAGDLPLTSAYVKKRLESLGIPYRENNGDSGIIAEIVGKNEGKTLVIRADMDGLHVQEENDCEYKSQLKGQMHGCGHDCHVAILLSTAEILVKNKDKFNGRVRMLFQTGEESGTGAKVMINEGALIGADAVIGIHVGALAGDGLKPGSLVILEGPVSAGKNKFKITIHGKGTHSAFPEKGIDPIIIASRIVIETSKLVPCKNVSGAVVSFGSINAGIDHNTIPETAELKGSIRCQDPVLREELGNKLIKLSNDIASEYGARAEVDLKIGSSTVVNDKELASLCASATKKALSEDMVITKLPYKLMGSDDFANYSSKLPSVYFMLNTNNASKGIVEFNHNPRFDVDEDTLINGVIAYVSIVSKYLGE